MKKYVIADLEIGMNTPWEEKVSNGFAPFLMGEAEKSYQVIFRKKDYLPKIQGEKVFENQSVVIFLDENGRCCRGFHDLKSNDFYAVMRMETENRRVVVDYLSGKEGCFGNSRKDFFYIGWEKLLICEERMILHSACVDTPLGGILFSGPSGIGKSTQADLWCTYQRARLLNGDKPILRKVGTGWKAYGSPYAGSSKCHINESCDVKAIVMLKKAENCSVRRLSMPEAFRKVYEQTTVNVWDKTYVTNALKLVMALVQQIPVYELSCTPHQTAVELLEKTLKKEE